MARRRVEFQGELSPEQRKRKNALERNRAWYARNRDEQRQRARGWQLANPERHRMNWQSWAERNSEHLSEKDRLRYERDPVTMLAYAQRYRAQLAAAPGAGFSAQEWVEKQEEFGGKCAYCLEAAGTTMDHIVPISRGGAHDTSNIVPACNSCNASKGNRSLLTFVSRGGGVV